MGGGASFTSSGGAPPTEEERKKMIADAEARFKEAESKRKMVEYRVYYSNFKAVNGVKMPHTLQRSIDGKPTEEMNFDQIKINPKIDARKFEIGTVEAELPLTQARKLDVAGPLGTTVIEVQPGRARVASDPSPRQYCVMQGWLTRPNAIAICAPNHVSLHLSGREGGYDSLNY